MKALVQFFAVSILLGTSLLSSCTDEITSDKSEPSNNNEYAEMTNTEIKKEFGAALAKVLAESAPVRELIKKEALRKIDYDYDVLYLMVKDEVLSDNTTMNNLLQKYVTSDFLLLVEDRIPNLTVFVPKLPLDSFSAETWNVDTEIPVVGIRTFETNDIFVFDSNGDESVIEAEYIPAYPIVVVKENERISEKNSLTKSSGEVVLKTKSDTGKELTFINDVFNNLNVSSNNDLDLREKGLDPKTRTSRGGNVIPAEFAKVFEAYDIFKNDNGWQRDYVYYNLTAEAPRGPVDLNYKECLVGFGLRGDPQRAINKIADQTGDPKLDPNYHHPYGYPGRYIINGWTDGEFEFEINVYMGGTELKTFLRCNPTSLFTLTLSGEKKNLKITKIEYEPNLGGIRLPLFEWDLEKYGSAVKIGIAEYDDSEVIKRTMTVTSEFATNFSFDPSFGEKVKVGLKFGNSNKETRSTSYEVTTTKQSDQLGEVLINFGDKILLSKSNTYVQSGRTSRTEFYPDFNSKYYNDWFILQIAPVKMN